MFLYRFLQTRARRRGGDLTPESKDSACSSIASIRIGYTLSRIQSEAKKVAFKKPEEQTERTFELHQRASTGKFITAIISSAWNSIAPATIAQTLFFRDLG